ncbi:MAG: hypothetical protein GY778_00010, partial [bacterium]|nr:hypothetical protein [bacterium]
MPILRDHPGTDQWAAIYTASDERLATSDPASGDLVQHWTLRSPSGQVLRTFRYGPPVSGESIFCDGFESGDTSAWGGTTGFTEPFGAARGPSCGGGGPEWSIHRSYVYRDGALLADLGPDVVRFYHLDHLGSVRQITNQEADVVTSYDYLPYGQEPSSSTAAFQFTGHERDSHLPGDVDNLDYMHARYYSPHLSRFISVDPVNSTDPRNPQSWNKYAYIFNNPLKYVDPDGESGTLVLNGPMIFGAANAPSAGG